MMKPHAQSLIQTSRQGLRGFYQTSAALGLAYLLLGNIPVALACQQDSKTWGCVDTPFSLGIDQQIRHISFEENYGGNVLLKHYRQNNLFAGYQFHENFGVEAGYQWTERKEKWSRVEAGQYLYGNLMAAGHYRDSVNNLRVSSPYVDLVGSYTSKTEHLHKLVFSLAAGLSSTKIDIKHKLVAAESGVVAPDENLFARHFVQRKIGFRISPAVKAFISERFGVRASFVYEPLSKFDLKTTIANSSLLFTAKPKNTYSCGLGIFYQF